MGRRRLKLLVAMLALINCRTAAKIIVEGKTSENIIINKYFIQMCPPAICVLYVCTSMSYIARKINIYQPPGVTTTRLLNEFRAALEPNT